MVNRFRRVSRTYLVLPCLLLPVSGCGGSAPTSPTPTPSPGPQTYTLSGFVRDAGSENPLEHARIELAQGESSMTMETGFPGTFAFTGVRGALSLTVMRDGYADRSQDFDLSSDTSVQLDLERVAGRSVPCGDAPDIGTRVLPILSRPFNGEFVLATYFDHGPDNDGYLLTSCGDRVTYDGGRSDGHRAYDWGAASIPVGTRLLATFDGTVLSAGAQAPFFCASLGRMVSDQLTVSIRSSDGYRVFYVHMGRVDVAAGQRVSSGQVIGLVGRTGCISSNPYPALHFMVFDPSNSPVDPYGWEGRIPDPWARQPGGAESVWLWRPGQAPRLQPCSRC